MTNATKIIEAARRARVYFVESSDHVFFTFADLDDLAAKIGEEKANEFCKTAQMSDKGMIWFK